MKLGFPQIWGSVTKLESMWLSDWLSQDSLNQPWVSECLIVIKIFGEYLSWDKNDCGGAQLRVKRECTLQNDVKLFDKHVYDF